MSYMENKIKIVLNASKISAIEEHLVNNRDCASKYNLKRFKIIKSSFKIFYSI